MAFRLDVQSVVRLRVRVSLSLHSSAQPTFPDRSTWDQGEVVGV